MAAVQIHVIRVVTSGGELTIENKEKVLDGVRYIFEHDLTEPSGSRSFEVDYKPHVFLTSFTDERGIV